MKLTKLLGISLLFTLSYNIYGMKHNEVKIVKKYEEPLFKLMMRTKKEMLLTTKSSLPDNRYIVIFTKLNEIKSEIKEFEEILAESEAGQQTCIVRDGAIVAGNDFINHLACHVFYKRLEKTQLKKELNELKTEIHKKCTL